MLRLTEMADLLVQDGMMEIYEATREKIGFLLKQAEEKGGKKFAIPNNVDEDDALDMFADNFDQKEAQKTKGGENGAGDVGNGVREDQPSSSGAGVSGWYRLSCWVGFDVMLPC
ncbi:hypothetical protein ACOMHN_057590 [Nucella lapillus]